MNRKAQENNMRFDPPVSALERWNPQIKAVAEDGQEEQGNVINIYDTIGYDYFQGGITAKDVNEVLLQANGDDVTVNINSAGGDLFEGIAIHSLLSGYEGNVTVKIIGIAASAASVIALAGDTIEIADSGFFMIHNSWSCACGNKHDMKFVADRLTQFDQSMIKMYAKRTGISSEEITAMMDTETWLDGADSVSQGFADSLMGDAVEIDEEINSLYNVSLRSVDVALAKSGMTRATRRDLIKNLTNNDSNDTPRAVVEKTTPRAGIDEAVNGLLNAINK